MMRTAADAAARHHALDHALISTTQFRDVDQLCNHLVHVRDYEEAIALIEGDPVLDLGCNSGYGTAQLAQRFKRVFGVDVSAQAIREAKRRYSKSGLLFRTVDGRTLPFADRSFGAIVCFQVIEHIPDLTPYLSEIRRVLSPGGRAIFTTPNAKVRLDPGMKPWNPFHVLEFTADTLRSALAPFFDRITVRGMFGGPVYERELARCQRTREEARRHGTRAPANPSLRQRVREVLPERVVLAVRGAKHRLGLGYEPPSIDAAELPPYTTEQLYYREEELDGAIDLMAVCETTGWSSNPG
jgi:SAM-dependent methyltransferase